MYKTKSFVHKYFWDPISCTFLALTYTLCVYKYKYIQNDEDKMVEKPDWKNLQWLSERLECLCIMRTKLRGTFKPLKTTVF